MIWIKRNLSFVLGSLAALVLTLLAGWYLYDQWDQNNTASEKLKTQYEALDHLMRANPHPGYPGPNKVDNLALANEQRGELRAWIEKVRQENFKPIALPIRRLSGEDLSRNMARVLSELRLQAREANVHLPQPDWPFSFSAEVKLLSYVQSSVQPVATQLSEVQAICEVLFKARINSLESIQREAVAFEDRAPGAVASDYLLGVGTVTNDLPAAADGSPLRVTLTPYQIAFRSSSAELAAVIAGFANSPHVFAIRSISVDPVPSSLLSMPVAPPPPINPAPATPPPTSYPQPGQPRPPGSWPPGSRPPPGQPWPMPAPAAVESAAATNVPVYKPGTRGGLPVVLDEKQLQTTMVVVLIKPQ
jgi:hypothetical protein